MVLSRSSTRRGPATPTGCKQGQCRRSVWVVCTAEHIVSTPVFVLQRLVPRAVVVDGRMGYHAFENYGVHVRSNVPSSPRISLNILHWSVFRAFSKIAASMEDVL